jgi:pimeloyl-ACP methyl ester carboxylesterase
MTSKNGYASLDRGKVYFEVAGSGTPLACVHGGLVDCRMWEEQFVYIAHYFRVLRYDLRGFGRSDSPVAPFYPHDDLKALLDFLKIEKAYIMGQSMGGGISIDFALEFPERVAGMILAGPSVHGFSYSEEFMAKGLELFTAAFEEGGEKGIEFLFQDPYWSYTLPSPERNSLRRRMRDMAALFFRRFRWDPGWMKPALPLAVERLSEISTPVLLITAKRDHPENRRVAGWLQKEIEGTRKVDIPEAGHMMNMEKPDRFNSIVLEFLTRLEG